MAQRNESARLIVVLCALCECNRAVQMSQNCHIVTSEHFRRPGLCKHRNRVSQSVAVVVNKTGNVYRV